VWYWESKKLIKSVVAAFIAAMVLAGCSDNPQNEAARQLRENAGKALDTAARGDIDKAAQAVQAVLRAAPQAGDAAEPVLLASADLAFEQAQRQQDRIEAIGEMANIALDEISQHLSDISLLQVQQDRLNYFSAATEMQINELSKAISGDSQKPGIQKELASNREKLALLEEQKAELEGIKQKAQDSYDSIGRRAELMLQQADSASGDDKLKLAQAGYDLLLTRKNDFLDAQAAGDRIRSIESQIAIILPLVQKLESDLVSVQQQIDEIVNSATWSDLKVQLSGIKIQIETHDGRIVFYADELKEIQTTYTKTVDENISLFQKAADVYKKLRSQSTRKAAGSGLAECCRQMAMAALDSMRFQWYFSSRVVSITGRFELQATNALSEVVSQYDGSSSDYAQKAMDSFNLATDEYSKLQKRFAGRDEFACDVLKNYILTIYGKMIVAEHLALQDVVDEASALADELVEKAKNCDSGFDRSITAKLLAGSDDFVPVLAVDNTMYYNELKKEFEAWKSLPVAEREAEVNRLLAMLDAMDPPQDPDLFNRVLGPERQQLEAALARGFEPVEAGAVAQAAYSDYGDPNYSF
jgi:hypothetical protein